MASPAFAIVGGPWDNNMFYGRSIDGTYQGVITGKNFSGVMLFGLASTSNPNAGTAIDNIGIYGNDGRVVAFTEGVMVIGQVAATADVPSRAISGVFDASALRGESAITIPKMTSYTAPVAAVPPIQPVPAVVIDGTLVSPAIPGTPGVAAQPEKYTYENLNYTYVDAVAINGHFDAKITKTFPWVAYAGKGKIEVETTDGWDYLGGADLTSPLEVWPLVNKKKVNVQVSGVRTSTQNPSMLTGGTLYSYYPAIFPSGN